jgi:hypothetical protein
MDGSGVSASLPSSTTHVEFGSRGLGVREVGPTGQYTSRALPYPHLPPDQGRSGQAHHLEAPPRRVWEAETRLEDARADPHEPDVEDALARLISPRPDGDETHAFPLRQDDLSPHGYSYGLPGDRLGRLESDGNFELRLGCGCHQGRDRGHDGNWSYVMSAHTFHTPQPARGSFRRHPSRRSVAYRGEPKRTQRGLISGGGGIRTHGPPCGGQRFSRPSRSSAPAPRRIQI